MPGGTQRGALDERDLRDSKRGRQYDRPEVFLRVINVAWASIANGDLMPGELVFNQADSSLVYRKGSATIYRFDSATSRSI